ncbi:MAG: glycosyltransferase, partial [Ilumatobacteraceae bacterium]|nr:glycosyltransferase [Ilumatobacteraceae bacterium]
MQPSSAEPSGAPPAAAPGAPRAQLTPRNIGITAAVAVVLHLPALIRKSALNSDEATIATVARMLRHGAQLYTSAVDRKPPGAFILYRVLEPIFGAWTLTAGRWLALTLTVIAMWILGFEARRRWPTVSPVAVAVLGIVAFSVLPAEDSRAVGFELLATLPAVAAFVLGARRRFLPAAVMLGLAGLFKQPMLLGAAPLAVQCLTVGPGMAVPRWSRRVLSLAMAGVVTAATVAAGLAPFGLRNAFSWFAGSGDKYLSGTHLSTVAIITLEQLGSV